MDVSQNKSKSREACPAVFGHGITWLVLLFILGISAWASNIYLMPLVNKAHTIADEAHALIAKTNDKFSLVGAIEKQVDNIDQLMPNIQKTVTNVDSTALGIDASMKTLLPRLFNTVDTIDTQVLHVEKIANRTRALVDDAGLVLHSILNTTLQANATVVDIQAQARALDLMLREANQTLQEIKAAQRGLASPPSAR